MAEKQENRFSFCGSMAQCWRIHKKRMQENGKPWVTYAVFRYRLVNLKWSLYKAIHTPADTKKRDKDRRRKVRIYNLWNKIKDFFRYIVNL